MVELYGRDGGEFGVNANTDGSQGQPATVRLASGEFVIVWTSFVSTGVFEVRGQLHSADGTPIGADFPVTSVTGNLGDARVEALSTGGFVVTWTYDVHDGTGTNPAAGTALRIHGQIFDSTATKLGGELTLTSGTLVNHSDSQPTALANGGFAVGYTRGTSTNNAVNNDVVMQTFDSAGVATGAVTLLSAASTGVQITPSLASLAGGGFVATWQDSDSSGLGIKAQLFDSAGAKLGGEFIVNSVTDNFQYQPTVAALASGGFVITWTHLSSGNDIQGQIFSAAGVKLGDEFLVNSLTANQQHNAYVAGLADGGFVVGWRDQTPGGGDLAAQVFDSNGVRQGIQFTPNSDIEGPQGAIALIGLADGGFAAVWTGTDSSGSGVRAQVFAPDSAAPTDIALSSATLTENAIENVAVATLSANGAANSSFTYQILADSTGGAFRIEGDQLVVDDNAKLDFESAPQATVTIRATDLNGQTYDEAIVLDVTDIDIEKRYSAGDEMGVNVNQNQGQGGAQTVALAGGGFAVIWNETDFSAPRHSPDAALLRLYDSSGAPVSGEIVLATKALYFSSLTPTSFGGFVAARQAWGEPSGMNSVKARAYDSAGNAVGSEMIVTGAPNTLPRDPVAIQLDGGGYVMAFAVTHIFANPPSHELHAQRFTAAGIATGPELTLAADFNFSRIGLVATDNGGFAATWISDDGDPLEGVPGQATVQFFNSAGAPAGVPLSVELGSDAGSLSLMALSGGGYVLAWRALIAEDESGLTLQAVVGQLIRADGTTDGGPIFLGAYIAEHDVGEVSFAAHPDGGFVASWPMIGESGGEIVYGIHGQMFDLRGNPVGEAFQSTPSGYASDLTVLANGSIVSTWQGPDASDHGIFARVYRPANEPPVDLAGDNVLMGDGNANLLDGQGGNDQLYGFAGIDDLIGGTGNDLLDGGSGSDEMTGGDGNDIYVVDDGGDAVVELAGEGTDEIRTALASFSLAGLAEVENLTAISDAAHDFRGNAADNVVTGGGGNDVLRLYDGGNDNALGGAGNDNIFFIGSLNSADVVNGGGGRDTLVLQGPYGSLALTPNVTEIEEIAILGGGNTTFGEPGTNRYDYVLTTHDSNFAAGVEARINAGNLLAGEDFTFDGSAETDARFVVYGGLGKDTITGGLNNDTFLFGHDRFTAGDTVNGGAGYDGMFLRGNYTIDFNAAGYTGLFTSIENLTFTSASDERYARGGGTEFDYNVTLSDALVAAGVTLTVNGGLLMASESMVLDGSLESDGLLRLFGGKAGDTLKGGGQNDLIHGHLGADQLTGNGGADTFRFDSATDSNSTNMDQIVDFAAGTDKVDLSRIDADSGVAGNQAFSWIGSNAFSGSAGQLRAYEQDGTWFVEGDVEGDGAADLVIQLTLQGATPLGAGDFLL